MPPQTPTPPTGDGLSPNDELGDISRPDNPYVYNERSQAMQRQKREHSVALHAIEEKARSNANLPIISTTSSALPSV